MFYTYVWLREKNGTFPKGTPYYVGKGKEKRGLSSKDHRHKCPSKENIRIQYWPDEATAFAYEMYLVDFYGRIDQGTGCLRNMTDGGENPPSAKGIKRSEEFCRGIAERTKGLKRSKEAREKMRAAKLGKKRGPHSALHKLRISKALQGNDNGRSSWGHSQTPEARIKMSQTKAQRKRLKENDSCQTQEF